MKKSSSADYLSCILFRVFSFFSAFLPKGLSLFLGRRLGDILYLIDYKHRGIARSNISKALGSGLSYRQTESITRRAYRAFGQNLVEISFIPHIDSQYLLKYIDIVNKEHIKQAFAMGKGVIFLAMHEGDWELSNIICANLGFPFSLFIRDQGFPRLSALLNSYRLKKGCRIIHKDRGLRDLIEALKNNQAIGMTVDQGGKAGMPVDFFGRQASMATGALKLALKYAAPIIPVFYTRVKGQYIKVILDQVYQAKAGGDKEADLKYNLQEIVKIFEKYIRLYPQEYLWTYKIWKYGREREVLILSDSKAGHLRQAESAANIVSRKLEDGGMRVAQHVCRVRFRNAFSGTVFAFAAAFGPRCLGQGFFWRCMEKCLDSGSFACLRARHPDVIISCGAASCALNYVFSKLNQAKSIILMRPQWPLARRFDLALIPRHDRPKPAKNTVITEGALNLIDEEYMSGQAAKLRERIKIDAPSSKRRIGLFIGGNTRGFVLGERIVAGVVAQVKQAAEQVDAQVLVTTSRRTSMQVDALIKKEFCAYARCKLLVIANENNLPEAVGGILGLSDIAVISPESISMVSEACESGKYVLVFEAPALSRKHKSFIRYYSRQKYIYLSEVAELGNKIAGLLNNPPGISLPQDKIRVSRALERLL